MILKIVYYLKLLFIIAFSTVFLASIETAPDRPLQFIFFSATYVVITRLIWLSAQHDEKKMNKQKMKLSKNNVKRQLPCKRAA